MSNTHAPRYPIKTRLLVLFVAGAWLGPVGDLCHVLSGTDGYPEGGAWRLPGVDLPFWVPLLFGGAALAIGLSHPKMDTILERWAGPLSQPRKLTPRRVIAALVALLLIWAMSGFLPLQTGGAKDLFMAACAVGMWVVFDRTWQGALIGIASAAIGTSVESTLVHQGAFFYLPQAANFLRVPSWLPLLYFCASIAVGNLGRALVGSPSQPSAAALTAKAQAEASPV